MLRVNLHLRHQVFKLSVTFMQPAVAVTINGHDLSVSISNVNIKFPIGKILFSVNLPFKLSRDTVANADIVSNYHNF